MFTSRVTCNSPRLRVYTYVVRTGVKSFGPCILIHFAEKQHIRLATLNNNTSAPASLDSDHWFVCSGKNRMV